MTASAIHQREGLPGTNGAPVGDERLTATPFRADVHSVIGLECDAIGVKIDDVEALPSADGIAIGHHRLTAAALCTDVLSIAGTQGDETAKAIENPRNRAPSFGTTVDAIVAIPIKRTRLTNGVDHTGATGREASHHIPTGANLHAVCPRGGTG